LNLWAGKKDKNKMDQQFEIPVNFKNNDLLIPAVLQVQGYTYRIEAMVDGVALYFERDDAGEFRALLPQETPANLKLPETGLVAAIAESLNSLLA
jgi:hypothetical protein